MNSPLKFKLPAGFSVQQLLEQLSDELELQAVFEKQLTKTYYDSFDWRLYDSGMICEHNTGKLLLKTVKNDLLIASSKQTKPPHFAQQLQCGTLRQQLEPILEMRALLPLCSITYQAMQFNILNRNKKTVLRLMIEDYQPFFRARIFLQIIKGYDKNAEELISQLKHLGCQASTRPLLLMALKQQQRKVNDYSSKFNVSLNPIMPVDVAVKIIYSHLLNTIKVNQQGTIADTDSEFLHDFRVAVRRTRAALSQLKTALPENINARYAEFFSWLGKITSQTRDMDVYLLNFDHYKNSLPRPVREHLDPLQHFLQQKQHRAQRELAKNLQSAHYLEQLAAWELFLKQPAPSSKTTIKRLADKRLQKNYQRVLTEGAAINEQSPCEDLHELRKSCKKLRYLLEFFQSLYEKTAMRVLLKALKELQEVLGDFQDCSVQVNNLRLFAAEMRKLNTPAETFLAIELLIENLNNDKVEIRRHFTEQFSVFSCQETQSVFTTLFG